MSKDPGGLSSTGTVGQEEGLRGIWHKGREQLCLQSFLCHITEPTVYPGSSRNHSEDLTRAVCAHFCGEITVEGNNTAEEERGTGLETGRLPRAEISELPPKKARE